MKGVQVIRPGSLAKSALLSSVVRNTSCSGGWLRLMVQCIFAAITVASFILIILLAIPKWPPARPIISQQTRCSINVCKVVCNETPFFGEYEEDIIHAISEVEENCKSIFLTLNKPMFPRNTLPPKWLSRLQTIIHELTITDGNLMHVPSEAFTSQYFSTIRVLEFKNLVLKTWSADSLVGLSSLQRLYVKDSVILNVPRDALRAVAGTLQSLTITGSNHWDPTNVTGATTFNFMKLRSVDFSYNSFEGILGQTSFTGLQRCKILYLNSCGITSIGAGAFDNLHSIEMLFLNNNHLVTIPAGLFINIMKISYHKPRINLQDNMWHCDCSAKEIRQLINKDMLLSDPVCDSPEYYKYKTFRELETNCSRKSSRNSNNIDANTTMSGAKWWDQWDDIYGFIYVSVKCYFGKEAAVDSSLRLISPVRGHKCSTLSNEFYGLNVLRAFSESKIEIMPKNSWIKLTYFLRTHNYSMVEIGALEENGYGLVWYQTTCPNEVYCVSDIPFVFRIYNVNVKAQYVFCPVLLSTGQIDRDNCLIYHNTTFDYEEAFNKLHIFMYIGIGTLCIVFGALCVYALIRKHPHLLKGSKRILFVKHKSVDALVLPPKVPLRNDLVNESIPNYKEKNIFVMSSNHTVPSRFNRNISTRSSRSNAPSYISALLPTEDQLAEWRIQHHFNNNLTITSTTSEISTFSWVLDDSLYHPIDDDSYKIYESLK